MKCKSNMLKIFSPVLCERVVGTAWAAGGGMEPEICPSCMPPPCPGMPLKWLDIVTAWIASLRVVGTWGIELVICGVAPREEAWLTLVVEDWWRLVGIWAIPPVIWGTCDNCPSSWLAAAYWQGVIGNPWLMDPECLRIRARRLLNQTWIRASVKPVRWANSSRA